MAAYKFLELTEIEANVVKLDSLHAELATIDENLVRNELTALERGEQLARRKQIYEALHPEARKGTAGAVASNKAQGNRCNANETVSFAEDVAKKTGLAPRTIQQDVQIATNLSDEAKAVIRETPLADRKRDLIAISRLPREEQKEAAERRGVGPRGPKTLDNERT